MHDSLMTYLTSHKLLHSIQSDPTILMTPLLQMFNKFLEALNTEKTPYNDTLYNSKIHYNAGNIWTNVPVKLIFELQQKFSLNLR